MSISEVKDQLPAVTVKMPNGTVKPGILAGRSLPYATVYVDGMLVGEWSWKSIAHAITANRPLIA